MSAYIVDDETINRIVSFLATDRDAKYQIDRLAIDLSTQKAQSIFGRKLFRMNCAAVQHRYHQDKPDRDNYWFQYELCPNRMQVYKSIQCFLYQCSEGNVPDSELFKKMEDIKAWLAENIISALPEYDKAAWG